MKAPILLLIICNLASCSSTSVKVFSTDNELEVIENHPIPFSWKDFRDHKSSSDQAFSCVYHQFDFIVNAKGEVVDPKLSKSTHPAWEGKSLEAIKTWKFSNLAQTKKSRVGLIYKADGKVAAVILSPQYDLTQGRKLLSEIAKDPSKTYDYSSKPIKSPIVKMPRKALRLGISGNVLAEFDILKDGTTANHKILGAYPQGLFEEVSLESLKQFRYDNRDEVRRKRLQLSYHSRGETDCVF
ncbi:MAG: energy transducer TonB [Pseudobacteriovorax sp.]|nr:energy transducer TonB [Pseudobacteriovorax sp.]